MGEKTGGGNLFSATITIKETHLKTRGPEGPEALT